MAEHYVYGAGQPSDEYSYYAQQGSAGGPAPGHHYGNAHLRPCAGVVQFRGHGAGSFVHAAATEYGYDQHGAAAYYVAVPDHSQTVLYGSVLYPTQAQQAYMVRCCRLSWSTLAGFQRQLPPVLALRANDLAFPDCCGITLHVDCLKAQRVPGQSTAAHTASGSGRCDACPSASSCTHPNCLYMQAGHQHQARPVPTRPAAPAPAPHAVARAAAPPPRSRAVPIVAPPPSPQRAAAQRTSPTVAGAQATAQGGVRPASVPAPQYAAEGGGAQQRVLEVSVRARSRAQASRQAAERAWPAAGENLRR